MREAVRRYVAEIVELSIDLLCALTNHAGACWIANRSPLKRLVVWAIEVRDPILTPTLPAPPLLGEVRVDASECVTFATLNAGTTAGTTTVTRWPSC